MELLDSKTINTLVTRLINADKTRTANGCQNIDSMSGVHSVSSGSFVDASYMYNFIQDLTYRSGIRYNIDKLRKPKVGEVIYNDSLDFIKQVAYDWEHLKFACLSCRGNCQTYCSDCTNTCTSACSGECRTGCSGCNGCGGCSGRCKGGSGCWFGCFDCTNNGSGCSGCGGCNGCSGSCGDTCNSCSNTCSNSCASGCGHGNCTKECSGSCSVYCSATCTETAKTWEIIWW